MIDNISYGPLQYGIFAFIEDQNFFLASFNTEEECVEYYNFCVDLYKKHDISFHGFQIIEFNTWCIKAFKDNWPEPICHLEILNYELQESDDSDDEYID